MRLGRRRAIGLIGAASTVLCAPALRAQAPTSITVHYSMPAIFKPAQDAVLEAFSRQFPGIRATYANPTPTYEDGAQLLLRGAATGNLPDVSFQGLNRLRLFAERGIAVDLRPLLAREGIRPVLAIRQRCSGWASTGRSRLDWPSRRRTRSRTTTPICFAGLVWMSRGSRPAGTT